MRSNSGIEWTDSTWNPTTGCTRVSSGCDNCYAATLANGRLRDTYLRQLPVVDTEEHRSDPFAVRIWPARLNQPEQWQDQRMVFVNSMSDLFHNDIPHEFLRSIFATMLRVDRHIYQVLTKRPARAQRFVEHNPDLFPTGLVPAHIWIGTSVERQDVAYRVRQLAAVPAEIRFLSCEPLLGPLDLDLNGIHWLIAGGESGVGHRPMDADWVRDLRDQCSRADVPFFFKQWGGHTPKSGGRALDDREWNEFPDSTLVSSP